MSASCHGIAGSMITHVYTSCLLAPCCKVLCFNWLASPSYWLTDHAVSNRLHLTMLCLLFAAGVSAEASNHLSLFLTTPGSSADANQVLHKLVIVDQASTACVNNC